MSKALLAAIVVASATAYAQTPPAPGAATPAPATGGTEATEAPAAGTPGDVESLRREMETRLEAAKKEMREELRAQLATQSAAQGWQEEWTEEKRKLELLTLDGYFRLRPDLFHKFDLNREQDAAGFFLFPRSPTSPRERTVAGANMRLRLEPTINVSEEVRVHMQVDVLDNLVLGSTPEYAYSRSNRYDFGVLNWSQLPPVSGVNSLKDSIMVRRAYGEVSTPVGVLRFGRMGSQWGLGMLHNDGNCLNCDFGDTVDRVQFVTEPLAGWYVTPMLDFNVEGPTSGLAGERFQEFDLSNLDDAHSYVLAIARRDTEQQAKAKLDAGQAVLNFGVHFTYRTQKYESIDFYQGNFQGPGGGNPDVGSTIVLRDATIYVPDVWVKYEMKNWRIEAELAALFGGIGNRALSAPQGDDPGANQSLRLLQYGAVVQGEYRLMEGRFKLGGEVGFASGDRAPGLGNLPRRRGSGNEGVTATGDIEGPQYACQNTGGCTDNLIGNFRFNRDHRIDLILWREILGPVTDAIYVRPTFSYDVAEGFQIFGAAIYSRTVYPESAPNGTDPNLGLELNGGARYQTEDGFSASLQYGILFPLGGLGGTSNNPNQLDSAQTLRGIIAIKF
jgi:uncharacterized protein (TIGR04551 family)